LNVFRLLRNFLKMNDYPLYEPLNFFHYAKYLTITIPEPPAPPAALPLLA
jgi:hypothetical protein